MQGNLFSGYEIQRFGDAKRWQTRSLALILVRPDFQRSYSTKNNDNHVWGNSTSVRGDEWANVLEIYGPTPHTASAIQFTRF